MPIFQLKCQSCGNEFERICPVKSRLFQNCECGGWTKTIPAVHGANCFNDSAGWIKSVTEVVSKDDPRPHVQAFLKDPTRSNYRAWMKGEGLRPLENGEKSEKFKFDAERHAGKIMEEKIKRERYEVRG
jgi:hypothetical protein